MSYTYTTVESRGEWIVVRLGGVYGNRVMATCRLRDDAESVRDGLVLRQAERDQREARSAALAIAEGVMTQSPTVVATPVDQAGDPTNADMRRWQHGFGDPDLSNDPQGDGWTMGSDGNWYRREPPQESFALVSEPIQANPLGEVTLAKALERLQAEEPQGDWAEPEHDRGPHHRMWQQVRLREAHERTGGTGRMSRPSAEWVAAQAPAVPEPTYESDEEFDQ